MGEDEARGEIQPFALNFDAVAHEIAHLVIFGVMGAPRFDPPHEYFAYHEAVADFIALIGLLHFDTALDHLLRRTRGNLLIANELDRFAELSDEKQVRMFSHSLRMSDVSAEVHDLSKPFAGALFDILVEIYQVLLFERGLSDLDPRDFRDLRSELPEEELEAAAFGSRSAANDSRLFALKSALEEARDLVGEMLVRSLEELEPHTPRLSRSGGGDDRGRRERTRASRFAGTHHRQLRLARDSVRERRVATNPHHPTRQRTAQAGQVGGNGRLSRSTGRPTLHGGRRPCRPMFQNRLSIKLPPYRRNILYGIKINAGREAALYICDDKRFAWQ